jgi:hypothetical protein
LGVPFVFKKKLALTRFDLAKPGDAVDLPDFGRFYAQSLIAELGDDRFIVSDASALSLSSFISGMSEPSSRQIIDIARRLSVQFVVVGAIQDISVSKESGLLNAALLRKRRNLTVNIKMYDGYSGVLVAEKRFSAHGLGSVGFDRHLSSLGAAFFESDFGQAVRMAQQEQALAIKEALACLPMIARVTRVDAKGVYFDAGGASLIRPGDKFKLIRRVEAEKSLSKGPLYQDERYGDLEIKAVYPQGGRGQLTDDVMHGGVSPGDLIRAW